MHTANRPPVSFHDFAANHFIYLSYVKPSEPNHDQSTLAVMRGTWDGTAQLKDVHDIFVADAWYGAKPAPNRCCGQGPVWGSWGGRILFGRDGKLYIASGDRNYGEMVQKHDNDFGKIMRVNPDGSIPNDNPFFGKEGWKPEIWTLGHRNPLGLTIDSATGRMWETEFGPEGGDELNIIVEGRNYGWIDVTQGKHYNGEPAKGIRNVPGMTDPVMAFGPPSLNPGNPLFYYGGAIAGGNGDLLLAMEVVGQSPYITRALCEAKSKGIPTAAIVGAASLASTRCADIVVAAQAHLSPGVGILSIEAIIYTLAQVLRWRYADRFAGTEQAIANLSDQIQQPLE